MKITFNNLINSEAYNSQAEEWSKSHIFVAFLIVVYAVFFSNFYIGWNWLWVLPVILFGSSLIIAMPTMVVNVWLASIMSPHMHYEIDKPPIPRNTKGKLIKFIKYLWFFIALGIQGFAVYKFLEFVGT